MTNIHGIDEENISINKVEIIKNDLDYKKSGVDKVVKRTIFRWNNNQNK